LRCLENPLLWVGVRQVEAAGDGPEARPGRVALTLRIDPNLHRKLRTLAFNQDTTIQDIIVESLKRMGIEAWGARNGIGIALSALE
jgi:hypothetical protein